MFSKADPKADPKADAKPASLGLMPPTFLFHRARSSTPSGIDKSLKTAAKALHPYLKTIMTFGKEFQARTSQYRLSVAEKEGRAGVALTSLYIGISAVFTGANATGAIVAIAIHDSVYLHDFAIREVSLEGVVENGMDPISDFVITSLFEYEHEHLCKFIGAGVPCNLEKIAPTLCSRLWAEVDIVPISLRPDQEGHETEMTDFTFWHARGVDEQADSMARKCIMCFGPNLSPLLQVGYRGIVEVDAGFRSHMHRIEDYKKSCDAETWNTMMKYRNILKDKKKKIAFFSSTPQGGGVALMRHALVRFARTMGVDLSWYVPKPKPGVFRITKTIHNILQGVAESNVRITVDEQKMVSSWIIENAERYWLSKGGPLQPPDQGGADIIIIDDPQMPGLIPLIKLMTPNRPVLYRSHIQIRSDLADQDGTPQAEIWNHLVQNISLADMFISHPIPSFVPANINPAKVSYMPATTDWMDGLNKPLNDWDTGYYINFYNQKCHVMRMAELEYPNRSYFIQIARFDPSKGIKDVIKSYIAFRHLLSKKTSNEKDVPQLLIVGNGSVDDPDGTLVHDQTMEYIDRHCPHMADSISVMRLETNDQLLNALISNAYVVLQLSIREGFEVKVSEALYKGRPVIATNTGGIPIQVQHGKNGFLVPPNRPQEVATHLMELWMDKELHKRMSKFAASSVSDEIGTVGNALNWFYLASQIDTTDAMMKPNGKWVNDMARDEAGIPYKEGEKRLPRAATTQVGWKGDFSEY